MSLIRNEPSYVGIGYVPPTLYNYNISTHPNHLTFLYLVQQTHAP
jgi:hypothetical protein